MAAQLHGKDAIRIITENLTRLCCNGEMLYEDGNPVLGNYSRCRVTFSFFVWEDFATGRWRAEINQPALHQSNDVSNWALPVPFGVEDERGMHIIHRLHQQFSHRIERYLRELPSS